MTCPVEEGRLARGFNPAVDPSDPRRHYGVDIAVDVGTPVTATAGGIVLRASDNATYGNVVVIDHGVNADGNYIYTLYSHLSQFDMDTLPGNYVAAGTTIGFSGGEAGAPGSGDSRGPHLHYEVILSSTPLQWRQTGSMGGPPNGRVGRVDPFFFGDFPEGTGGSPLCDEFGLDPSSLKKGDWLKPMNDARQQTSPLVLDLDGDGIETLGLDSTAYFDHDDDGFSESTGWTSGDDGFLVRDIDGNGRIDSGRELFGNETLLGNGQKAANGFVALADLDTNSDGKIDDQDSAWANLKIWKDLDGDGASADGEIFSLEEFDIQSISTGYSDSAYVDPNGNAHKQVGTFTRTDSSTSAVADVWFATDRYSSIEEELLQVPAGIEALPEVEGSGVVRSLRQAMVRDSSGALQASVQAFATAQSTAERNAILDDLLFEWAGTSNIAASARGTTIDARKAGVLEKFSGESWDYVGGWAGTGLIHHIAAAMLAESYHDRAEQKYAQLMAQTSLKDYYDLLTYHWDETSASLKIDTAAATQALDALAVQNPALAAQLKTEFVRTLAGVVPPEQVIGAAVLDGGSLDDSFTTSAPASLVHAGAGNDTVNVASSVSINTVYGGDGNDVVTVTGTDATTTAYGEAGNDSISGGNVGDYLNGGTGDDVLNGGAGDDVLTGGAGNDVLNGGDGNDLLLGADDSVPGEVGNDTLSGGNGDDTVYGGEGNNVLNGDAGNDVLIGGNQYDEIHGGTGNDLISDGGGDGVIYGDDGDDQITVSALFWGSNTVYGGDGNDVITVVANSYPMSFLTQNFYGGRGDDVVTGSVGYDLYHFDRGDGADTIRDYSSYTADDKVIFGSGVVQSDLVVGRIGNDITVAVLDPSNPAANDRITVKDWFYSSNNKIERWEFANGSFLTSAQLESAAAIVGTSGNDTLVGFGTNDRIYGFAGNDSIQPGSGDDISYGGVGNDTITDASGSDILYGEDGDDTLDGGVGTDTYYGGAGNDLIGGAVNSADFAYSYWNGSTYVYGGNIYEGGQGNDTLRGTMGGDVFRFSLGDGQDVLQDGYGNPTYNVDRVVFGSAVKRDDVTAARAGNDLILNVGSAGDRITVVNHYTGYGIERLEFADGTVVLSSNILLGDANANTMNGSSSSDLITGSGGNDSLNGNDGTDTLFGDAGNDTIYGGNGNDFAHGGDGADTVAGDGGDDVLFGDAGSDNITGGTGNDYLAGGTENDTADGGDGNDIAQGGAGDDQLQGGIGNDVLTGDAGNDTLDGGDGNDLLAGGAGNDSITTGAGSNVVVYNAGGGVDTVYSDTGASNALSLGGGIRYSDLTLSKDGSDLHLHAGGTDEIVLKDWYAGNNTVTKIQFILDASTDYDPNSADPLYSHKVETFDFGGLVNSFDQARAENPGLSSWALTNALLDWHLAHSDDAALGGDLAYWYGKNNALIGMGLTSAQQAVGAAGFGSDAQTLHAFNGLQEGLVKLT